MAASPKNQLRDRAAALLTWLNTPGKQVGRPESKRRRLHRDLRLALLLLTGADAKEIEYTLLEDSGVKGRFSPQVAARLRIPGQSRATLERLMRDFARQIPPLPYNTLVQVPVLRRGGLPRFVYAPNPDGLDEHGQRLHAFRELLEDLSEKGYDRLKFCRWPTCRRFMWDRTNERKQLFCAKLHDHDRLLLRAKRSRLKLSTSR